MSGRNAVLVHGVMSLAGTWRRIEPALAAQGWTTTALDLPAHGDQPPLGRPLTVDSLVDSVCTRLVEPVDILIGHSLGAVTALAVAARRPDVARALVLEDPPGTSGLDHAALAAGVRIDAEKVRTDRAALERREVERNPHWDPADVTASLDGIAKADVESISAGFAGPLRWDLPALVAAAPMPVLVLAAPEDEGVFPEQPTTALRGADRQRVRELLPPSRFVELPGGHCLHRDDPARYVAEITTFADRVFGSPAQA